MSSTPEQARTRQTLHNHIAWLHLLTDRGSNQGLRFLDNGKYNLGHETRSIYEPGFHGLITHLKDVPVNAEGEKRQNLSGVMQTVFYTPERFAQSAPEALQRGPILLFPGINRDGAPGTSQYFDFMRALGETTGQQVILAQLSKASIITKRYDQVEAQAIKAFLTANGLLNKPLQVIGYSYGALVAGGFIERVDPAMIADVALCAPAGAAKKSVLQFLRGIIADEKVTAEAIQELDDPEHGMQQNDLLKATARRNNKISYFKRFLAILHSDLPGRIEKLSEKMTKLGNKLQIFAITLTQDMLFSPEEVDESLVATGVRIQSRRGVHRQIVIDGTNFAGVVASLFSQMRNDYVGFETN